jgi:hypothetical protein
MDSERELRQLWYTAKHYWDAAKAVYDPATNGKLKCGEVAKFYDTLRQPSDDEKRTTFLIADISSAAVRLCTIDERLYEERGCWIKQKYSMNLNRNKSADILISCFRKYIDTWIHQMLRDNAAHIERGGGNLWQARQEVIESLTINEIVIAMEKVMKDFERELIEKHIIT